MHSLLFTAIPPKERADWADFVWEAAHKLEKHEGVVRLAENVWLLNLRLATDALGLLIVGAQKRGISYGVLPFEREPQWLPADFDPTSIQDRSE